MRVCVKDGVEGEVEDGSKDTKSKKKKDKKKVSILWLKYF